MVDNLNIYFSTQLITAGTIEWSGDDTYDQRAHYGCDMFSEIQLEDGTTAETYESSCQWNKTWTEPDHGLCQGSP